MLHVFDQNLPFNCTSSLFAGEGILQMVKTKTSGKVEAEKSLAERCRIALEKNYGMPVPVPKSFGRKESRFWETGGKLYVKK